MTTKNKLNKFLSSCCKLYSGTSKFCEVYFILLTISEENMNMSQSSEYSDGICNDAFIDETVTLPDVESVECLECQKLREELEECKQEIEILRRDSRRNSQSRRSSMNSDIRDENSVFSASKRSRRSSIISLEAMNE
jgi:hypothetical protein